MAVAVCGGLLVGIVPAGAGWGLGAAKAPEVCGFKPGSNSCANRTSAAHVEDLHDAGVYTRLADNSGDCVG